MTSLPLAGKRVLVTRAADQSDSLVAALAAAGADVIAFPTIEIRPAEAAPVHAAIAALQRYDWICFTSVNGVRVFWDRLLETRRTRLPPGLRVAAVGPLTRRALMDRGVVPDCVPDLAIGAALGAAMGVVAGSRVLLARASRGREEVIAGLRQRGAEVTDLAVYETVVPAAAAESRASLVLPLDAATFTSPLTVEHLARVADAPLPSLLSGAVIACIGPTTSDAARLAGLRVHIEPAERTTGALAFSLISYFRRQTDRPLEPLDG